MADERRVATGSAGTAVVVGGGLAGVTSALRLADAGRHVILLEARPRLGGSAFSFRRDVSLGENDARVALWIDNGQHVFLRCCEAYRWLLERLGVAERVTLQPRLDITVLRPDGRSARLRRTPGVPAPAHLGMALAGYGLLSPSDRARAVRGALALRTLDPADPSLDDRTLGEFLRSHGQTDAVIDSLWSVVVTATLNLHPDDASLALAAKVFRTGLLDHAPASDVGYAAVPLGALHHDAALAALRAAGVDVRLATKVEHVATGVVRLAGRGSPVELAADDIVLALPPRDAVRIAPGLERGPAGRALGLGTTPILNVHVVYDRRVTDLDFAAGVDSPVQWFFDRTETSGLRAADPAAQYLAITVSAADDVIDVPARELQTRYVAALAALLPAAAKARVLDSFVTRERHATFRQAPGSALLRPGPDAGTTGIWLAGAWTSTGWPDTMESAVRSGINAAEAVLQEPRPTTLRFAA